MRQLCGPYAIRRAGKIIQKFPFMPIFYQQDIDANTRLGIWAIREEGAFFGASIPLQRTITHPQKRRQHLAGRYLLRYLFPEFPIELIRIADTRKPFLEEEAFHFSISHCGDYAAAIVSRNHRAGIDVELTSEKVHRIRHKFITPEEEGFAMQLALDHPHAFPTLLWSLKEAVFKWYGDGGVDFRRDINVRNIQKEGKHFITDVRFRKIENCRLTVQSSFHGELCLSWVAGGINN